jgi:hypothetical protein
MKFSRAKLKIKDGYKKYAAIILQGGALFSFLKEEGTKGASSVHLLSLKR